MKSFARNRKNTRNEGIDPDNADGLIDIDELDIVPLDIVPLDIATDPTPIAADDDPNFDEAADFTERLGDLDRFIGGGSAPATRPTTSVSLPGNTPARNLPAAPIPAVAPLSHPRPTSFDHAPEPSSDSVEIPVADPQVEAQDFLDRLSDLDRFIGGNGSAGSEADVGRPPSC